MKRAITPGLRDCPQIVAEGIRTEHSTAPQLNGFKLTFHILEIETIFQ
jgi:hypothetical protein